MSVAIPPDMRYITVVAGDPHGNFMGQKEQAGRDVNMVKQAKQVGKWCAKIILLILFVIVLAIGVLLAYEYRPSESEDLELFGDAPEKTLRAGDAISVMTWNIGFGALGDNADFFMDGGKAVNPATLERAVFNLSGIIEEVKGVQPDLIYLQEIDQNAKRSHGIAQTSLMAEEMPGYQAAYAQNLNVAYLPYPFPTTIGHVDSGIETLSRLKVSGAKRIALPDPFKWPVRAFNLKRCLLVSRIPVDNGKELVAVNLHLEAYDSGEGKAAQTKVLADFIQAEREKGNYVIVGGDFNQYFSNIDYSMYYSDAATWMPGILDTSQFPEGWQCVMDNSAPSCRSLQVVYAGSEKEGFPYFLIDGFIVSDNIKVESVETRNLDFVCSDHNPVLLRAKLQ